MFCVLLHVWEKKFAIYELNAVFFFFLFHRHDALCEKGVKVSEQLSYEAMVHAPVMYSLISPVSEGLCEVEFRQGSTGLQVCIVLNLSIFSLGVVVNCPTCVISLLSHFTFLRCHAVLKYCTSPALPGRS